MGSIAEHTDTHVVGPMYRNTLKINTLGRSRSLPPIANLRQKG